MGERFINDPYAELGVSSRKEGVHKAVERLPKGIYPGAFCEILPTPLNIPGDFYENYAHVVHTDGVGTKSNVAYLAMKEGISDKFLYTLVQDAIVMNIDDMACVGVTNHFYISNHIARNANRVNDEALAKIIEGYRIFDQKMQELGVIMYMAGGETADVGSYTTTMGIDVTASAFIPRKRIIDCSKIGPGQYIVGLASDGRCSYERKENSGIRSNGLTLAINTLLSPYYRKYTETMDSTIDQNKLFCGKYRLEDNLDGTSLTIAEAILSPTRTYVPVIRDILDTNIQVTGIIHCSGGGLTKSINFGKGITYVKDEVTGLRVPPIFKEIQWIRRIEDYYMYQTFNMGIGMEVIVKSMQDVERVMWHSYKYGIEAHLIGHTEASPDGTNKVKIGSSLYTK